MNLVVTGAGRDGVRVGDACGLLGEMHGRGRPPTTTFDGRDDRFSLESIERQSSEASVRRCRRIMVTAS